VVETLSGGTSPRFLRSFVPFQQRVANAGMVNSLAQLVLKLASPGVADFYQGSELWDLSLVDPDNRREVDFERRQNLLNRLLSRYWQGSNKATDATQTSVICWSIGKTVGSTVHHGRRPALSPTPSGSGARRGLPAAAIGKAPPAIILSPLRGITRPAR
jgi:maltooligosyltrehalose synthase